MKTYGKIGRMALSMVISAFLLLFFSCKDDDKGDDPLKIGTITGMITDTHGAPIADVHVVIDQVADVTSQEDGHYTLENIPAQESIITFSKEGYQSVSVTVTKLDFENLPIQIDVVMDAAAAKMVGVVADASNNGAPLANVKVSLGQIQSTITGSDGTYSFENISADNYIVTFEKEGLKSIVKKVSTDDFVNGVATLNVTMGGTELLLNKTIEDLKDADKWYYNEYRGGRNAENYPHWDWACDYMCTLDFQGAWEEQNEGTTLQIRNNPDQQSNPADLDRFDSYVCGSKKIFAENKIMTLQVRTHAADAESPAYFGVQVIDLSQTNPTPVKIGQTYTYGSEDYSSFDFDLSAYINKEVIIAIGLYRKETGDYWKQLVLRRIAFASQKIEGWDWLPGTGIPDISTWKLTREMVLTTMPQTHKSFTGISPKNGDRDNYVDAYRSWIDVNHLAVQWSFVPLNKDPEVFPSEGFIIKTRGDAVVNTVTPEAYFYAKFAIMEGSNQLTMRLRTFGSNCTFFKLTAITEEGAVTHLSPISNTAIQAAAADNGCWKFLHEEGSADSPESYAKFIYDLSAFNGKNIVLVLGVYKGESNGDENKMGIYSIELN